MRLLSLFLIFGMSFITCVHAKRVALVIGNDEYANVTSLQKAANDAKAVAATIRELGFEVILKNNVDRRTMDQQLNKLNALIETGDEVMFFFAGHGISVRGQNYLLPTDIPKILPGQERSVTKEAFSENEIISLLQERGAKVSIIIIDACRNNPFPAEGTRSVGRSVGLGHRANPPRNTFIMYSAGIGQQALDRLNNNDKNPNSVFTRKLIPLLKTKGLSHVRLAKRLQIEVEELALTTANQHKQFPAFYDQVRGDYYLIPGQLKADLPIIAEANPDLLLWKSIEGSQKPSDFQFYLDKFPNGKFADIAELNKRNLSDKKVALLSPKITEAGNLWQKIEKTDDSSLLRGFLKQFKGDGIYSAMARDKLRKLLWKYDGIWRASYTAPKCKITSNKFDVRVRQGIVSGQSNITGAISLEGEVDFKVYSKTNRKLGKHFTGAIFEDQGAGVLKGLGSVKCKGKFRINLVRRMKENFDPTIDPPVQKVNIERPKGRKSNSPKAKPKRAPKKKTATIKKKCKLESLYQCKIRLCGVPNGCQGQYRGQCKAKLRRIFCK